VPGVDHDDSTFRRFDGRLMLDILYQETDPRYLQGEPDTYWIQYGGGDSEDWCRKLAGRCPLLHMKDYKVTPEEAPAFAARMKELGKPFDYKFYPGTGHAFMNFTGTRYNEEQARIAWADVTAFAKGLANKK